MKKQIKCMFGAVLFLLLTGCFQKSFNEVTFLANFTDVELSDSAVVGIRGSIEPLSWTETYPMIESGNAGYYAVNIRFDSAEPGTTLLYKYVIDEDTNTVWENDMYGSMGNRSYTFPYPGNVITDEKWDNMNELNTEGLLEYSNASIFYNWLQIIGTAKKRGLTPEEIAAESMEFWKGTWDWLDDPVLLMEMDRADQARSPIGNFKIIKKSSSKYHYQIRKYWEQYLGEEGMLGVTSQDFFLTFKSISDLIAAEKGWSIITEDKGENIEIIITTY